MVLLQSIIEDQKNKNEYVPFCEKVEETLRERGYGNCDHNNNQEHIYENIDELRDDNVHMSRSDSVLSINSDDTWNWYNDKSEHQTLSNPQSDNKKGSRTPDSGYRSDNDPGQQDSKIVASSSRQPNTGKPSISPKPANLQTRPQAPPAKKRPENKTSNPSFNKAYDSGSSSNQVSVNSVKEKMKIFKNCNTLHPHQQQCTTAPQNKGKSNASHVSTKTPVTSTTSTATFQTLLTPSSPSTPPPPPPPPTLPFPSQGTSALSPQHSVFEQIKAGVKLKRSAEPSSSGKGRQSQDLIAELKSKLQLQENRVSGSQGNTKQPYTAPQNKGKLNASHVSTKTPVTTPVSKVGSAQQTSKAHSVKERMKIFENYNTLHPNQQQCTTAPQNRGKLNGSHTNTKTPVTNTSSKGLKKMPENITSNPASIKLMVLVFFLIKHQQIA